MVQKKNWNHLKRKIIQTSDIQTFLRNGWKLEPLLSVKLTLYQTDFLIRPNRPTNLKIRTLLLFSETPVMSEKPPVKWFWSEALKAVVIVECNYDETETGRSLQESSVLLSTHRLIGAAAQTQSQTQSQTESICCFSTVGRSVALCVSLCGQLDGGRPLERSAV